MADELDDLLESYKNTSMVIEEDKQDEENEIDNEGGETSHESAGTSTEASPSQPVNWQGNPAYYQSGKKQGQLKKNMAHKSPPKEEMEISGTLIDGALFIMLVDLLFPMLITMANNNFTKTKIDVEDLQLSEKQKKDLTPISNEVVKHLTLNANPVWLMVIAMSGIYGINFMAAKQAAKNK